MVKKEKKEEKGNLDDEVQAIMNNVDLADKTEMQGVAHEIFLNKPSRSNITHFEASACFVSNIVFPTLGMAEQNPVNFFLELKKSQNGWATGKFVETAGGVNEQRSGAGVMNKLFGRKE